MYDQKEEIALIVICGTSLMLLLTVFILLFIFFYRKKYNQYQQEITRMQEIYQQELLKSQLEIREQTLHYISQEIHDNIGQVLSLVKLNLNAVQANNQAGNEEKIQTSKELVGKAIQDLRSLSKSLNTDYINRLKLSESLQIELDMIQKTGNYETQLKITGTETYIDPQKQLIIFRIAQEVFNNILKHAQALHIEVLLEYAEDLFVLKISDDGIGFDAAENETRNFREKGTGLGNMFYRTRLIGGEFFIESKVQQGTRILLKLPF
jgi:two-component system, NarL family, sensor kinase